MSYPARDPQERFWTKVDKQPSGCWIWTANKGHDGYGLFNLGPSAGHRRHRNRRAHRLSYEWAFGKIPEGMNVCHKCDIPLCVNPDHLFLGTHQDNVDDKVKKNRHGFCETHPGARFSNDEVMAIRLLAHKNIPLSRIARLFSASYKLIHAIVKGTKNYQRLPLFPVELNGQYQSRRAATTSSVSLV